MSTFILGLWGRVGVLSFGIGIVLVSIVLLVCLMCPGSWLHKQCLAEKGERKRKKFREKDKLFGFDPPMISYKSAESRHSEPFVASEMFRDPQQFRRFTPPFLQNFSENVSFLGSASAKRDSTYSSMSETSRPASPASSRKSSAEGSLGSGRGSVAGSPVARENEGQMSFALQFVQTKKGKGIGKLIITILEAHNLPGRPYMGGVCDPYVKVVVSRQRRSLRKLASPTLHEYQTRTLRHTCNPAFNESFVFSVAKNELKDLIIKVVAMDCDKLVSPTTLGEVIQPLKDLKSLATNLEKTSLNFFLTPVKLDLGEILFGLSYLPTAQRLSVTLIKANHLQYVHVVNDLSEFNPFVRVLLVNSSGRVLKRKKTTFKISVDKPVWNETLMLELANDQVDQVAFIVAVCTRSEVSSEVNKPLDSSHPLLNLVHQQPQTKTGLETADSFEEKKKEKCLGKVILGCTVSKEEGKKHWMEVIGTPRRVLSQWHSLE